MATSGVVDILRSFKAPCTVIVWSIAWKDWCLRRLRNLCTKRRIRVGMRRGRVRELKGSSRIPAATITRSKLAAPRGQLGATPWITCTNSDQVKGRPSLCSAWGQTSWAIQTMAASSTASVAACP